MNKIISIWIMAMLLTGMFMVMDDGVTRDAESIGLADVTAPDMSKSGYLFSVNAVYNTALAGGSISVREGFVVGQRKTLTFDVQRIYLTFNTSSIAPGERIVGSSIHLFQTTVAVVDFDLFGHSVNYGASLTTADWDTSRNSTFNIANTSAGIGWLYGNVPSNDINTSGVSQFQIRSSREGAEPVAGLTEWVGFHGSYLPYITITTVDETEAIITYNFTSGSGMTNRTSNIYPVEIIDWGTQNLYRYELWSSNQSYNNLSMPSNTFIYQSINPYATVTAIDSRNYTITDLTPNAFYWIWFTVNKTANAIGKVSMYREATGQGIPFDTWAVYLNSGSFTNETTMERVREMEIDLIIGYTYTVSIYDYFPSPNFITNYTFIVDDDEYSIDVPVPYSPINFNNFRNDTCNIRIFYEGNTSNPYQFHVPGQQFIPIDIRGGDWMFAIDNLATVGNATTITNTTFLNLTANSTLAYTINIGESGLSIISTTVSGISTTVTQINVGLQPSLVYSWQFPFAEVPFGGTRSPSTLTQTELTHVAYNAFQILDGQIMLNGTGTNVTLNDTRPTDGSVRWLEDNLYISAYPSARIMINTTSGNIVNLTAMMPFISILSHEAGNITVWSNQTISVQRSSVFRQVQRLIYSAVASSGYYSVSAGISNPSTTQYAPVFWYVSYAVNPVNGQVLLPDYGTVSVYDVNNAVTLQASRHYSIGNGEVSMMLEYLNASTSRTVSLRYYLDNGTAPLSTPILSIRSYEISTYRGTQMYKGSATYTNLATASYAGGMQLSLKGLNGVISPKSLVLYDVTNDRELPDEFWSYSGTTIDISSEIVGTIAVGDSVEYAIYFKYDSETGEPFFLFDGAYSIGWLNINWHLAIFIVGLFFALLGIGDFIVGGKGKEGKKQEARGVVFLLIACFIMIIYFMLFIWKTMGAL